MMDWYGHMTTWGWISMGLWTALVIAGIVALIAFVARPGSGGGTRTPDDPLDILKRRYAAGEIGDEEFEQRRRHLVG